jgi:hypothetical protein
MSAAPSGDRPHGGALFIPHYRPMRRGRWELRLLPRGFVPGYWSDPVLAEDCPVLLRDGETWMALTPVEFESQQTGILAAAGQVLVCGLGMGWAAAATAARGEVERVTVVESDAGVIGLVEALGIFDQLPGEARAKLRIVHADAFDHAADGPVDLLMPDIWRPMVSDGRVDEVRRLQAAARATDVSFWGQELEIARHAVAAGRALDHAGVVATVAEFGLPLIGLDQPDYPAKVEAAARRWMRGRWLPGTAASW